VSAGSFTIIASPVVLSKLFHQKNLSSVLKRKAGLHSCTTLPVGLNYDGRRSETTHHRISHRKGDFRGSCFGQELRKHHSRIGDSFLEGSVFFRISSHKFASALSL